MDLGKYQNNVSQLPSLGNYRYENIFKVYQTDNAYYYYNLLSTVTFPDNLDDNLFYTIVINEKVPWPVISYNAYGVIDLWWLIALINGVRNPLQLPAGNKIKILKAQYIRSVMNQISQLTK